MRKIEDPIIGSCKLNIAQIIDNDQRILLQAGEVVFQTSFLLFSIDFGNPRMATRDLQDLVEKAALIRHGELRHTRYFLAVSDQIPITE